MTMKRTAAAIAKKNKQKEKKPKIKEKKGESEDDEDYSAMLASCFLAPVRNAIKRDLVVSGSIVMATDLHSVHKHCGIDSDAGVSISTQCVKILRGLMIRLKLRSL